jgi:hypothetical protein
VGWLNLACGLYRFLIPVFGGNEDVPAADLGVSLWYLLGQPLHWS